MKNLVIGISFLPFLFIFQVGGSSMKIAQNSSESETKEPTSSIQTATLAGGCFWCVEADLEKLYGVQEVISGYAGGEKVNPKYKEVASGLTNHIESVQITFDSEKISYSQILDAFWRKIDPTDEGGQFVDRGFQYSSAIFYHNEEQKKLAEQSKQELEEKGPFNKPIATVIRAFKNFYTAEDYHQDYYKGTLSQLKYKYYRNNSGRDQFLQKVWGDFKDFRPYPALKEEKQNSTKQSKNDSKNRERLAENKSPAEKSKTTTNHLIERQELSSRKTNNPPFHQAQMTKPADTLKEIPNDNERPAQNQYSKPPLKDIKKKLTNLQYQVTQKDGTEPAFKNEYWDNKQEGIYVDIVSGEPLFSSLDKYDSGTGWPSFTKPLVAEYIVTRKDRKLFMVRTEVRSKYGDSHLGHVFEDGPAPKGLRYCINSSALRFISKENLKKEGYGLFANLFE